MILFFLRAGGRAKDPSSWCLPAACLLAFVPLTCEPGTQAASQGRGTEIEREGGREGANNHF